MAYTGPDSREAFDAASGWLSGNPDAAGLSNDIKLELYGIFKLVTTGGPSGGRPSIFYPTARAKYDAWTTTHAKYTVNSSQGTEAAIKRYIEIAKMVGWKGEGIGESDEDEIDFDSEPSSSVESAGQSKSALGVKVSMMSHSDAGDQGQNSGGELHDAVIDDRLDDVQRILQANPTAINSTDDMGNTPLHLAVDRGHANVVKLLVSSGADRHIKDQDSQTPLDVAELLSRHDIAALLR